MIYVREVGSTRPFVADEKAQDIMYRLRKGELTEVPTATPADLARGQVTTDQIRKGEVVVTDGSELEPPETTVPLDAEGIAKMDAENQEKNRADREAREYVRRREQEDVDMMSVGGGVGKLMTVDQFLASGARGYIHKSALNGYHSVDPKLILSGRVRVVED